MKWGKRRWTSGSAAGVKAEDIVQYSYYADSSWLRIAWLQRQVTKYVRESRSKIKVFFDRAVKLVPKARFLNYLA
eukprot:COSAG02_NODE_7775_length_2851_cov_4.294331_2_plen_75_part_00